MRVVALVEVFLPPTRPKGAAQRLPGDLALAGARTWLASVSPVGPNTVAAGNGVFGAAGLKYPRRARAVVLGLGLITSALAVETASVSVPVVLLLQAPGLFELAGIAAAVLGVAIRSGDEVEKCLLPARGLALGVADAGLLRAVADGAFSGGHNDLLDFFGKCVRKPLYCDYKIGRCHAAAPVPGSGRGGCLQCRCRLGRGIRGRGVGWSGPPCPRSSSDPFYLDLNYRTFRSAAGEDPRGGPITAAPLVVSSP